MTEKHCFFRCYNCNLNTEFTLQISEGKAVGNDKLIEKKIYCKFCNRLNLIDVPSNWDAHPLVLGDDDFLGYDKGTPVFQGKKV